MAQLPIIRRTPEGGQKFLLSLTVTHPVSNGPGPTIDFQWDGDWVKQHGLPALFSQQILAQVLQTVFAAGLAICSNVTAPQEGQN